MQTAFPQSPSHVEGNTFLLDNGNRVRIRRITPDDIHAMIQFHQRLSEQTVRFRYFAEIPLATRTTPDQLTKACQCSSDTVALVAVLDKPGPVDITAVGRLCRLKHPEAAELALTVADPWQHHHLGALMLGELINEAKGMGVRRIHAEILRDNRAMHSLAAHFGFQGDGGFGNESIHMLKNLEESVA